LAEFEYAAQVTSPVISGEVKLIIGDDALTITGLFDVVAVPYADMSNLTLESYTVRVVCDTGMFCLNGLGNWCQPFFDALTTAYHQVVLKSLFVAGDPVLVACGDWQADEGGQKVGGCAALRVYPDCVVSLPNDMSARRVPLAFVTGLEAAGYAVTLHIGDDRYDFSRLGYDHEPFVQAIQGGILALRDQSLAQVLAIDGALTPVQASQLAKLMPAGAAVPLGQLNGVAASFSAAVEASLNRSGETFQAFCQLVDPASIAVGFKASSGWGKSVTPDAEQAGAPYVLWLVAPSPNGQFAAVEFAEPDAATFVYKTNGDVAGFVASLSRALEAISFHREVIRLGDEELRRAENAGYRMAVQRTAALAYVRGQYVGRVIHAGHDTWLANLQALWSAD